MKGRVSPIYVQFFLLSDEHLILLHLSSLMSQKLTHLGTLIFTYQSSFFSWRWFCSDLKATRLCFLSFLLSCLLRARIDTTWNASTTINFLSQFLWRLLLPPFSLFGMEPVVLYPELFSFIRCMQAWTGYDLILGNNNTNGGQFCRIRAGRKLQGWHDQCVAKMVVDPMAMEQTGTPSPPK